MKNIYVIRHCEAEGQSPQAPLTQKGMKQAGQLAAFFSVTDIDRIISSPYLRAVQTIQPLAEDLNRIIEEDERLTERVLSTENLPDWFEKLKVTYDDLELKFQGGESSKEAMDRIVAVVEEIFTSDSKNTILVTHGNLLSLLLMHLDPGYGFRDWQNLSNPDVFLVKYDNNVVRVERNWRE